MTTDNDAVGNASKEETDGCGDDDGATTTTTTTRNTNGAITTTTKTTTTMIARLPRPSREKHERAMKTLNDDIEAKKSTIESAKTKIKALRDKREKEQAKYAPLRSKLNELVARCQILIQPRDTCRKEVQVLDAMGKGGDGSFSSGNNKGRGKSAEQIDAEVARIEDQISHETMSLKEEKVLVERIKQLNKMKDAAKAMAWLTGADYGTDGSRKAMQEGESEGRGDQREQAEQQKLKNEIDKIRGVEGGNNRNKKENGKSSNGDNFNKNMKALESEKRRRV